MQACRKDTDVPPVGHADRMAGVVIGGDDRKALRFLDLGHPEQYR